MDRSFVQGIKSKGDNSIIDAIIAMAKGLNLDLIAEGVENEAQVEHLTRAGCYLAQGFFYAPPMPEEKLLHCFKTNQSPENEPNTQSGDISNIKQEVSGKDQPTA